MRASGRGGRGGRGRGGVSLGDHMVTRTASPTHRYPANENRPIQSNNPGSAVDLRITGWTESRISNTEDSGLGSLTAWLERKAQTALDKDAAAAAQSGVHKKRHTARIRKVCLIPRGVF
jgi:hypothetical protein